jgi:hypothetical protein
MTMTTRGGDRMTTEHPAPTAGTPVADLEVAIDRFLAAHVDTIVPAGRAVNDLLDVWAAAQTVSAEAAAPVERLLTALVSRDYTTPAELAAVMRSVMTATDPHWEPAEV